MPLLVALSLDWTRCLRVAWILGLKLLGSLFRDVTLTVVSPWDCYTDAHVTCCCYKTQQWPSVSKITEAFCLGPQSPVSSLVFCSLPHSRGDLKAIWFLCRTPSKLCLKNCNQLCFLYPFTSVFPFMKCCEVKAVDSPCADWGECRGWKQKELVLPVLGDSQLLLNFHIASDVASR